MVTLDASSVIYAWDNYPPNIFPQLWEWIGQQFLHGEFQMAQLAFEEVQKKTPDCASFLNENDVRQVPTTQHILFQALEIKKLLGIVHDNYHPDGVGENDIIIIATAHISNAQLVTEESRQAIYPRENRKLKIPGTCQLPELKVPCINFLELIQQSNQVFG